MAAVIGSSLNFDEQTKQSPDGSKRLAVSDVLLQKVFQFDNVFLNIIVMTLGEIEFNDVFLENNLDPFHVDVRIILFIFLFLMPIVLMNLLVRPVFSLVRVISVVTEKYPRNTASAGGDNKSERFVNVMINKNDK